MDPFDNSFMQQFSNSLSCDETGIYYADSSENISYPIDGNNNSDIKTTEFTKEKHEKFRKEIIGLLSQEAKPLHTYPSSITHHEISGHRL